MSAGTRSDAFIPSPTIIKGDFPRVTEKVTVARTSETFAAGCVLGQVTVGLKCKLSTAAAGDGSEVPFAVLAEPIPAAPTGDAQAVIYLSGEFHAAALTFGAGHTADSARAGLRDKSIFI